MDRRTRNKLATMARVQSAALNLFEERGYANVSIADVAEAADVAERTIYRHFGTKERLITHDQMDVMAYDRMAELSAEMDLVSATRIAVEEVFALTQEDPVILEEGTRRLRLMTREPELTGAFIHELVTAAAELAAKVAAARGLPADDLATRVSAYAVMAAFGAAAQTWLDQGPDVDLVESINTCLDALKAF